MKQTRLNVIEPIQMDLFGNVPPILFPAMTEESE